MLASVTISGVMPISTHWGSPPQDLPSSLVPRNVHVWRVPLDHSPERAARFRPYLSTEERIRADRCRTPHPQYQFVVTRGILRILLSHYLGVQPTELQFATQPHGKPMLVTPSLSPIQFNVSHAQGMALIAITLHHSVGIDVEWIDRKIQDRDIAERYFSVRESAYLATLTPPERSHQFFSHWTCKEAYLKMQGKGIAGGLEQCELSIDPDQPEVGLSLLDQQKQKDPCSLHRMRIGAEHVGAVAIACATAEISYWNWQDEMLA